MRENTLQEFHISLPQVSTDCVAFTTKGAQVMLERLVKGIAHEK